MGMRVKKCVQAALKIHARETASANPPLASVSVILVIQVRVVTWPQSWARANAGRLRRTSTRTALRNSCVRVGETTMARACVGTAGRGRTATRRAPARRASAPRFVVDTARATLRLGNVIAIRVTRAIYSAACACKTRARRATRTTASARASPVACSASVAALSKGTRATSVTAVRMAVVTRSLVSANATRVTRALIARWRLVR